MSAASSMPSSPCTPPAARPTTPSTWWRWRAAAGITLTWDDFADLAAVTPLLCRIYPSGQADVNHFHAAGGTGFLIRELLEAGLLHEDVRTVMGHGLAAYAQRAVAAATDERVPGARRRNVAAMRPCCAGRQNPFQPTGGLMVLDGISAAR